MLYLKGNVSTTKDLSLWIQKGQYTVGRTSGDLVIKGDVSISRTHAIIDYDREIIIRDKSKFGTFVNGKQVTEKVLKPGDIVVFGLNAHSFILSQDSISVCCSGFVGAEKTELSEDLDRLGFQLKQHCKDVHCVITKYLNTTPKIVSALALGIPIVSPDWVKRCHELKNLAPTEPFLPPIASNIQDIFDPELFRVNLMRKQLFSGVVFHSTDPSDLEQAKTYITSCGGQTKHINSLSSIKDRVPVFEPRNAPSNHYTNLQEIAVSVIRNSIVELSLFDPRLHDLRSEGSSPLVERVKPSQKLESYESIQILPVPHSEPKPIVPSRTVSERPKRQKAVKAVQVEKPPRQVTEARQIEKPPRTDHHEDTLEKQMDKRTRDLEPTLSVRRRISPKKSPKKSAKQIKMKMHLFT
ncbi:hypothetical protein EDD86DRAFT_277641 [Gorgonomyces haynaldii]|nr:hypothetical protein EDD86DRAFT_277641 [Gorgonomyces haynaldii]